MAHAAIPPSAFLRHGGQRSYARDRVLPCRCRTTLDDMNVVGKGPARAAADRAGLARARGPLRVLHVIDSLGVGGAEQLVVRLAEATAGGPIQITVATLRARPDSPLEAQLRTIGTPLFTFPMTRFPAPGLRPAPRALARLVRFVRTERFSVIHTHLNTADVVGAIVGGICGVPVVSTQHSVRRTPPNPLRDRIRRLTLRYATREIIAVGASVAATQHLAAGGRTVAVIPNPAPPPSAPCPETRARIRGSLGLSDVQPVLLAVGRLEPPKNHALMLDAMRLLVDDLPGAALLIAGSGSLADELAERVAVLDLAPVVRLLGHRNDVDHLLAASDIFVSSSAWEGMPIAILEALAAGLPVVATDVGDCREVIGAGGRVVASGDPAALRAAVLEALEPQARAAMSIAARERAQDEYGIASWVSRLVAVYERAAFGPEP